VTILGYQNDEVLRAQMASARAFVFAAEEDFGIVPVEAQACGTPVIAFGKGGTLETVRGLDQSAPTGVHFHEQSIDAIIGAVNLFEQRSHEITAENCVFNAQKFSAQNFREAMKRIVSDYFPERRVQHG
jgi:glycosyltransferase involved in cell wall biosynthesis